MSMKPYSSEDVIEDEDYGYGHRIQKFKKDGRLGFVDRLMEQYYDLKQHMAYDLEKNEYQRKYRDSGLWSVYDADTPNTRVYSVQVGCSCSHDCCGHRCSLSYTVTDMPQEVEVTINESFNY